MKIITTILIAFISITNGADVEIEKRKALVDFYREWSKLETEFPDNQEVRVMFVDLDQDGQDEAFATSVGSRYEDGWAWHAFKKAGDIWKPIRGKTQEGETPSSAIFARAGEVFSVVLNDGSHDFLILSENHDKLAPNGLGELRKSRFRLTDKGFLQQEPVPNLEQYIAYQGSFRSGLLHSMTAVKVDVFPTPLTQKNEEQNKAQHPTDGTPVPEKPKE